MKETFDFHRATPHTSLEDYVKRKIVELGELLDGKSPIYLDMNFWINLQKAATSSNAPDEHRKLLNLLREAVSGGKIFCPISESIFLELLKQSDPKTRLETANLIDDLSLGVAMLDPETRAATELTHFIHSLGESKDRLHPIKHLVWLKVSHVLGITHPHPTPFDEATQLVIQKAFFDEMWKISLSKMVGMLSDLPDARDLKLDDSANKLNVHIAENAETITSFKQLLDIEIQGATDLYADTLTDIIDQMNPYKKVPQSLKDEKDQAGIRRMAHNLLFQALKSNKDAKRHLPSIYVHACLHAAFRWDKTRRLNGNYLYDFNHASAALAHCRAFFTDHPLHVLISSKNIGLDKLVDCQIISNIPDAIAYLEKLKASGPTVRDSSN